MRGCQSRFADGARLLVLVSSLLPFSVCYDEQNARGSNFRDQAIR